LRQVQWTGKASSDVIRLHEFLSGANTAAAARVVKALSDRRIRQTCRCWLVGCAWARAEKPKRCTTVQRPL